MLSPSQNTPVAAAMVPPAGESRKSAARVNWPERNRPSIDCAMRATPTVALGRTQSKSRWLPGALRSSTTWLPMMPSSSRYIT